MGAVTNEAHAWSAKNGLVISQLMPTPVCITSKHLCTAGLYAAHDPYHIRTLSLPCVKLSPTCHAALERCGEARDKAAHLHDLVSSSLVCTVFVSKAPIRVHFAFM